MAAVGPPGSGTLRSRRATEISNEGKAVINFTPRWALLAATVFLAGLAGCTGEPPATRTVAGTYAVSYDNVGGLVGFRTGTGTLTLKDGSEYAFKADGYSLAALGYTVASATGNVYNLDTPADFSGEYGAVVGTGSTVVELKNSGNNVLIDVTSSAPPCAWVLAAASSPSSWARNSKRRAWRRRRRNRPPRRRLWPSCRRGMK
ncbi:MAG: hypothetical protein ACPGRZ_08075 [Alphaproteobacteria bacterium]